MTQFDGPTQDVRQGAAEAAPVPTPPGGSAPGTANAPVPGPRPAQTSPVAAALAELDELPGRELAEHAEAYQRIHVELQSALATIDNA